jgi:uncharacterized protein YpmS
VVKRKAILALISLATAALACSIFVGGPAYPDTPVPVSTDTEQTLQTHVEQAISDAAQTGTLTLQITESQMTSYLASKLDSQPNPLITEPQVLLRDGQMKIYGKAQSGIFTANVSITTKVTVDENGQPEIEITQTDFGPLPAPQGLNDAASAFVREAFTGSIGPIATGFRLESISIADGTMTVSGRIK